MAATNPPPYWQYLRAFALARSGEKLTDLAFYTIGEKALAPEEVIAAVALAAFDAATGKAPRSRMLILAEIQHLISPEKPVS